MESAILDTNVLVYAIDTNSEFHQKSRNYVYSDKYEKYICSISLSEAYSILTRKRGYGMAHDAALQIIRWYRKHLHVRYPDVDSAKMLDYLVSAYNPTGNNIFNMEIASVALAGGIRKVVTGNGRDFKKIKEVTILW